MEAMQFSLRQVEIFRAAIKFGTVTAAARALRSSQPTISRELRRMEDSLGFALFERRKQRIHPTARALTLYHEVEASYVGLGRINDCIAQLRDASSDMLCVHSLPALAQGLLPEAVARLIEDLPQVAVEIDTVDPRTDSPISGFNFDVGLVEDDAPDASAEVILLGEFEQICILPRAHPLCAKLALRPEDFAGVAFVSLGANDPYRLVLDRVFREAGVVRTQAVTSRSAHSACELVAQGVGVSIVNPLTALAYLGRDAELRPFSPTVRFVVSALRPHNRPMVGASIRLVAHLKAVCEEKRALLRSAGLFPQA